jgi:hypothetical protein
MSDTVIVAIIGLIGAIVPAALANINKVVALFSKASKEGKEPKGGKTTNKSLYVLSFSSLVVMIIVLVLLMLQRLDSPAAQSVFGNSTYSHTSSSDLSDTPSPTPTVVPVPTFSPFKYELEKYLGGFDGVRYIVAYTWKSEKAPKRTKIGEIKPNLFVSYVDECHIMEITEYGLIRAYFPKEDGEQVDGLFLISDFFVSQDVKTVQIRETQKNVYIRSIGNQQHNVGSININSNPQLLSFGAKDQRTQVLFRTEDSLYCLGWIDSEAIKTD